VQKYSGLKGEYPGYLLLYIHAHTFTHRPAELFLEFCVQVKKGGTGEVVGTEGKPHTQIPSPVP
jgi:hypothetical protein